MRTLEILLVLILATLVACSPGGNEHGGGEKAPEQNTEQMKTSKKGKDHREQSISNCGAQELVQCALFGLDTKQLMAIRREVPLAENFETERVIGNTDKLTFLRAARVIQWIQDRYPQARVELTKENTKDFVEYFNSFNWKGM